MGHAFFDNRIVIFYIILGLEGGWKSKAARLGGAAKTWGLGFRLKAGIAGWKGLVLFTEVEVGLQIILHGKLREWWG